MTKDPTNSIDESKSLFQAPKYHSAETGQWYSKINDAISQQTKLTWSKGVFLATLGNGYPFGNGTLFNEIQRQPWLSRINQDGSTEEMPIPPHGLLGGSAKEIGKRLFELICDEAEAVCAQRDHVYVLLSGGLDSRVIAGTISYLLKVCLLYTSPSPRDRG